MNMQSCLMIISSLLLVHVRFTVSTISLHVNSDIMCIMREEDVWKVHSWYFAEAKTITLEVLTYQPSDNALKDYVDNFLKLVYGRSIGLPVLISVYNFIQNRTTEEDGVDDIIATKYNFTTSMNGILNQTNFDHDIDNKAYVIIVWNEHILKHYLKSQPQIIKNSRASYLILYVESNKEPCEHAKLSGNILPKFWYDFRVLNAITIAPCSCHPQSIFKFDPFFFNHTSGDWGLIKHWTLYEDRNSFFAINNLHSFEGVTINVAIFERDPSAVKDLPETMSHYRCMRTNLTHGFAGLDGCVLGNLAFYLNFHVNFLIADRFGYKLENGSFFGSISHIIEKQVEFAANSRFMLSVDMDKLEYTIPIRHDLQCFIVPMPELIPKWRKTFQCFKLQTWLLILCVLFIISLCLHFGWQIDFHLTHGRHTFVNDFLDIFGMSLGISISCQTAVGHQRLILTTCMIFNVILAGIFQGLLFTSFTKDSYYPFINTLQQLYDSGLPIVTSIDVFQDGESRILKQLETRLWNVWLRAINRTAYQRDIIAIERRSDAMYLIQTQFVSDRGAPLLHIVPECPSSCFLAYAVPKDSPYLPTFNTYLTRFLESGLINKWHDETEYAFIMQKKIHTKIVKQIEKAFTMEDVQTAFYLLTLGVIFASLFLFCEVLYAYMYHRRSTRKFKNKSMKTVRNKI